MAVPTRRSRISSAVPPEIASAAGRSRDLSESIERIWLGPGRPKDLVANLRRAGGTSIDALGVIATNESVTLSIRASAVWLLGRLKQLGSFRKTEALQPLLTVLVGPHESLRREAAQALGVLRDQRATGDLVQAMVGDPDTMVGELAAQSLGNLGSPKAILALREVFNDPKQDPSVRGAAAEALGASFTFDCASELISGLSDRADEVRFWSAYALGFMRIKDALPELERLASTDDAEVPGWWSVSKEAAWAIAQITEGPPWR